MMMLGFASVSLERGGGRRKKKTTREIYGDRIEIFDARRGLCPSLRFGLPSFNRGFFYDCRLVLPLPGVLTHSLSPRKKMDTAAPTATTTTRRPTTETHPDV
jgi:hypothetical protein